MGKFDGYLLISDFDGTLAHSELFQTEKGATPQKTISRENCDAIRYFQSEGGLFTLATGRQFGWLDQWSDFFVPNTYVSSLNGALICDVSGKDVVFSQPMDGDFLELALRIRAACPNMEWICFHSFGQSLTVQKHDPLSPDLFPSPVYKMVFYAHRADSDEYAARVASLVGDRYISMRSWINGIEVQKKGTGKGDSILRFKQLLGDRARTVVAVGDYENDLDMVLAADIGYAVQNAVPQLLAAADRVTTAVNNHAIAHIIDEL